MSESCCAIPEKQSNTVVEYAKFVGVILGIALATFAIQSVTNSVEWMQHFMGWFLTTFAVFKFIGYDAFKSGFPTYDLIAARIKSYAPAFPFIELGLGLLLLFDLLTTPALVVVLLVMVIGALGIGLFLASGKKTTCACLGGIIDLPLSVVSLVEAVLMAIMAAALLV